MNHKSYINSSHKGMDTQVWMIIYLVILYFQNYNWYQKEAFQIWDGYIPIECMITINGMYSTARCEGEKLNLANQGVQIVPQKMIIRLSASITLEILN